MTDHERILLEDAIQTAIETEKKRIKTARLLAASVAVNAVLAVLLACCK